jgi:hypothetical protein
VLFYRFPIILVALVALVAVPLQSIEIAGAYGPFLAATNFRQSVTEATDFSSAAGKIVIY